MFEDIHELDTARIDELHLGASNSVKSLLAMKLCGGDSNAGSSNGSVTSASSNNTPRSSHFDFFWIEQNNPSEQEDINQVFTHILSGFCLSLLKLVLKGDYKTYIECSMYPGNLCEVGGTLILVTLIFVDEEAFNARS